MPSTPKKISALALLAMSVWTSAAAATSSAIPGGRGVSPVFMAEQLPQMELYCEIGRLVSGRAEKAVAAFYSRRADGFLLYW